MLAGREGIPNSHTEHVGVSAVAVDVGETGPIPVAQRGSLVYALVVGGG